MGKTQIQNIVKEKENIKNEWQKGSQSERKYVKARRMLYGDLNERVWNWFCSARSKNILITGKLIQEKAIIVSIEMGHDNFTASIKWVAQKFQKPL